MNLRCHRRMRAWLVPTLIAAILTTLGGCARPQWFKGNTHTHTWWSDGNTPPELVTKWYKDHGYDFLVLSDHNVLSRGEKWAPCTGRRVAMAEAYEQAFDTTWIEKREGEGAVEYRLKTLEEIRPLYEVPGEFLLIEGEEISDGCNKVPVHLNGLNLAELIPPQHGETVLATMQNNFDAVAAQAAHHGRPMLCHLNHPNFSRQIVAEDIAQLRDARYVEVYNGHPGVRNHGDDDEPAVERLWDIILTLRLGVMGQPAMLAVATDDAHDFAQWGVGKANPGRGWVMVRASRLSADAIMNAMLAGDFYATTGVVLQDITFRNNTLTVQICPEPDVTYTTQFIGTRKGYDATTRPRKDDEPDAYFTKIYSDEVGQVFAEQAGTTAAYTLTGDEIYVRAKVISSAKHPNPHAEGDLQEAWVQPVTPTR